MKLNSMWSGLFGGTQQQQPQQMPQQQLPQPQVPQQPQAPQGFDFANLWSKPEQAAVTLGSPLAVNTGEVAKLAKSKNFLPKGIPPEVVTAMQSGDFTQFANFLNNTMQFMYHTAMTDAMSATSQSFDTYGQQVENFLPQYLRQHEVNAGLTNEFADLNKPEFKPLVSALTQQFAAQNPAATPKQIQQHVAEYIGNMAQSLGYSKQDPSQQPQPSMLQQANPAGDTDWASFAGYEAPSMSAPTGVSNNMAAPSASSPSVM